MSIAGRPSCSGGRDLHLYIDVLLEAWLKGGGAKLGEKRELVGTLSNAEPLDVPFSLSVQPHNELSPKPTMDTVNTHLSLSIVRTHTIMQRVQKKDA